MTNPSQPNAQDEAYSRLANIAFARANAFGLLAFAFFDPTPEFVEKLTSGSYFSEVHGYFRDLTVTQPAARSALDALKAYQAQLSKETSDDLLHALKVEFARLFIGPGHMAVPPYETFYGHKLKEVQPLLIVSPAAIAVESLYREAGVALSNGSREPTDHFATEAEFVYYLCRKESDAWTAGENEAAKLWRRRQLVFLDGHLAKWGCQFCEQVEMESRHPFYRAIAHFGKALLQLEGSEALQSTETALPAN